jgi:hypothetical protein
VAETRREYWMRVYTGMAMQSLIGESNFDTETLKNLETLANRAVTISKAVLDELEVRHTEWIQANSLRK